MLKKILYFAFVILLPVAMILIMEAVGGAAREAQKTFQMMPFVIYHVLQYLFLGAGFAALFLLKPKKLGKKAQIVLFAVVGGFFFLSLGLVTT